MAVQASLGSDIAMAFDECPPAGAARADLERAVERTARWAERCVAAPRPDGPAALRDRPGRHRPRAARALGRPAHRAALRRLRDRRPERGGGARADVRRHGVDRRAAAGRAAALLHGHRRPRGHPARDRLRHRHVRLRAADAARPHGLGDDVGRAAQPPQRALRPRRRPAAGGLRVPGVQALLARLHPPPRDAGRAARAAPADAAQRALPARVVPRGAPCDHRAPLRGVFRGGTRAARLGHGAERATRSTGGLQ